MYSCERGIFLLTFWGGSLWRGCPDLCGFQRVLGSDFSPAEGFPNTEVKMWQWLKGRLVMAKIIEFYIPKDFRKGARWVAAEQRGQVIEFSVPPKKSA